MQVRVVGSGKASRSVRYLVYYIEERLHGKDKGIGFRRDY